MAIKQQLVKRTNRISKGKNLINYITIHETANTGRGSNAQAHANLQSNGNPREASWHYSVDDKQVIQSFPDTAICWHAGKGNSQSIGIEICVNSDGNYAKAVKNAIALVKILMARYNLNAIRVVQHNFWTGKDCPHFLRSGKRGINWTQFKSKLNDANVSVSDYFYLKQGDIGERVRLYQEKLKRAGYKIDVDGSFGPGMLKVVKQFQTDNDLAVDGYLGPDTQKTLNTVLAKQKGDDEQLNLNKSEREEIVRIFTHAREKGIFQSREQITNDSQDHEKHILNGTMTLSRLQYLQTIIAGAGINDGKRIK